MDTPDDKFHYTPHPVGVKPLLLPEVPLPSSPSTRKKTALSKWLLGPSSTPIAWSFDPDHITAYTEVWQVKWNYYQQTFPEDTLREVERMSEADIRARARWLESELKRVEDGLTAMDIPKENLEIYSGMMFIGLLLHEASPYLRHLDSLRSATSDDQVLNTFKEELRNIERMYGFFLQTYEKIVSLRNLSVVHSMKSAMKQPSSHTELTGNSESGRLHLSVPASSNSTTSRSTGSHVELEMSNPSNRAAVDDHGHIEAGGPRTEGQTGGLSAVSSHRTNLAALLAIAFFGASVAWSAIFSGTRGNLVVISWAASVFIVGCTAAASASLLVATDESFMARYMQVRWTVRILTLISATHVFAGVMLVGTAIAVLDPNASAPFPGKQDVSRYAVKAAGGYAVGMAIALVVTMITVRRRYTQRTWFR